MVQTTAPSVSNGGSKKSKKSKRNSDGEGSAEKEKKKKKKEKKKKKVRALSGTNKKENILISVCFFNRNQLETTERTEATLLSNLNMYKI